MSVRRAGERGSVPGGALPRRTTGVQAIISDFGGVLTSPLIGAFAAFQEESGISLEQLGVAMAAIAGRQGSHPLFELEKGRITEAEFLRSLAQELSTSLGHPVELHRFGERYLEHLHPNERMIGFMRELGQRGYSMAICTNNVREWERLWRAKLPVEEIFDVIVDSAFVGSRKPEPPSTRSRSSASAWSPPRRCSSMMSS